MAELLRDSEKSPILPPEAGFLHPSMGGSWAPLRVLWRTELHALLRKGSYRKTRPCQDDRYGKKSISIIDRGARYKVYEPTDTS